MKMKIGAFRVYKFTERWHQNRLNDLEHLEEFASRDLNKMELSNTALVNPMPDEPDLITHLSSRFSVFRIESQEKLVPNDAMQRRYFAAYKKHEMATGEWPNGEHKHKIIEQVNAEVYPNALIKAHYHWAWIDWSAQRLFVSVTSDAAADDTVALLRAALDSLPVELVYPSLDSTFLTRWFIDPLARPEKIRIESDLVLEMKSDREVIKSTHKNLDLESPEIAAGINSGMRITKLLLQYDEVATFKLDHHFGFTAVKFDDRLQDGASDEDHLRTDMMIFLNAASLLVNKMLEKIDVDLVGEVEKAIAREEASKSKIEQVETELTDMAEAKLANKEQTTFLSEDPLYDQAVEHVVSSRKANISSIQRKLRIGYNRSARIMEDLEIHGVVSPIDSNGSREVLIAPQTH